MADDTQMDQGSSEENVDEVLEQQGVDPQQIEDEERQNLAKVLGEDAGDEEDQKWSDSRNP